MPYYESVNLLFIHIPKTGGTVFENKLKKLYVQTLYSGIGNNILPKPFNKTSLQHQRYITLYENRMKLNINFENIKVFALVRNPYDRVISDLFWHRLLKKGDSPKEVYNLICNYVKGIKVIDKHHIPQYHYVTDINGELIPSIMIFKTENLNNDNDIINKKLEININIKKSNINKNYSKYLNTKSIKLINKVYAKDFELFDYKKR